MNFFHELDRVTREYLSTLNIMEAGMPDTDVVAEAERILASPPAHMILSTPEWRRLVAGLVVDAKRYRWARPILAGDDDKLANERAMALAIQIAQGKSPDDAIDTLSLASWGARGGEDGR